MTSDGLGWEKSYFSHLFYDNYIPHSGFYNILKPCLEKLNIHSLIKIRANLNLNYNERYHCDWHVDQFQDCKTALFYINTTNGFTEIKDGEKINKIECEENKMVIFDSHHVHRLVSQTDKQRRLVINFNFYEN